MTRTARCSHTQTQTGPAYGFTGPVYTPGQTHENRAAHGAVVFTETCDRCGATRKINSNGRHEEVSAWSDGGGR